MSRIEVTGNIVVHHPDVENRANALRHHAHQVNHMTADQHNPDGER